MDKALAIAIGTEARRARTALGLTQQEVAERLGCSLEFYGRIERGGTIPSVPTLHLLRAVLGTSADALLGVVPAARLAEPKADEPPPANPRERLLRRVSRRLHEADLPTLRLVNDLLLGLAHLHAAWARPRPSARGVAAR
jgi:transcriptional regulator with XRE-family HTH domain